VAVAHVPAHGDRPGLHNLLDFYFQRRRKASCLPKLLCSSIGHAFARYPAYVHHLSDIHISGNFAVAGRLGWKADLVDVFRFWGLAHSAFAAPNKHTHDAIHSYADSLNEMGRSTCGLGNFSGFIGVWIGVRWAQGTLSIEPWARRAAVPQW